MRPHLTFGQLTILVGTAVAVAALLIFILYVLHKALRGSRRGQEERKPLRASDGSAFALATMQGIIANLKQEQRKLEDARCEAEQAGEKNARLLEVLAGAMDEALVVFTPEGFIRLINPPARVILGADTFSRPRYSEILAPESPLAGLIRDCLEGGKAVAGEKIDLRLQNGKRGLLLASVLPLQTRTGSIEGALCLLREVQGTAPSGTQNIG